MADKFIDDVFQHIEEDIQKIQTKPTMYISYLGERGAMHLVKELVNNGIDECINTHSPGDTVAIVLDEGENSISVGDNGRGIEPTIMELACTKIQAGSKFNRDGSGGQSAGEHGCGLTCCNALSERFEIIVNRYGERHSISFNEGKLVKKDKKVIKDAEKHGTSVILVPSKTYLGTPCTINADDLTAYLDKIIYITPRDVTLNLAIKKKGKDAILNKKYRNKNGLYDYVTKLCPNSSIDPVHILATRTMKQELYNNTYDRFMGLEFAFAYDPSKVEFVTDSFCNFVNTVDNGTHVDGVKTAISQYFSKAARDSLSEREAKKLDITYSDVLQGLVLTVYLSTDYPPMFTGQTKEKVGSPDIFKPIREMAYSAIADYCEKNPKVLKKIIDRIKVNARARIESTKIRNSVSKGKRNNLEDHMRENFAPANNKGKEYKELIIIEGRLNLLSLNLFNCGDISLGYNY